MRLSTAKIQNATAQKKTVRLFDGRGLYLEIAPTGSRVGGVSSIASPARRSGFRSACTRTSD
jgi:hypothetical protein